jgi:transposase
MAKSVLKSVQTKGIGFAPILRHFFEKSDICEIIDSNVDLDPRRKILTHGEACISMITGILFQVLQLYRLCKFADETTILDVILPHIQAAEYFDDRLADTLDALFDYGTENLEFQITNKMISEFKINNSICHNDTTSVSTYGDCDNNRTEDGINITFGFSKKKRKDLKQLVWSLSVSSDSAFPLFQKAYSGNTADVETYVEQWNKLIDLLDDRGFLFVADSKLVTKKNMSSIHDNDGFFIAPVPMYESYKNVFYDALAKHEQEILIPYKKNVNRGFETPITIEYEGKIYSFRMVIIYDHGLFARKSKTLSQRAEKTEKAFKDLAGKLNQRKLKTFESIDKACAAILKKNHTEDFFEYNITNNPKTTYKNKKRGRPSKDADKVAVNTDHFSVSFTFNESTYKNAQYRCGYYPLITNKPEEALSIEEAMMAHKNQYKCEHTNRRAKSNLSVEPIYLHTPERIEAFLFLFKIALQIVVLIERTARNNIADRDEGLNNFMPNKKDVKNPKAEYLLAEFQYIVSGEMKLPDGKSYGFISELNDLQKDIISLLDIPEECFSYEYIFNASP